MTDIDFLRELSELKDGRLRAMTAVAPAGDADGAQVRLLQVALANEIGVSELAASWMPTTPEVDIKIALARQAGDEARHFQLVEDRLKGLGFDMKEFSLPGTNPLFEYLQSLASSVERVAAGLFTLESIAYNVNENFMRLCALRGDQDTVRIYRDFIQPDEAAHQRLGAELLRVHATTPDLRARAREAVLKTLDIAAATRARAAARIGTACFPGC